MTDPSLIEPMLQSHGVPRDVPAAGTLGQPSPVLIVDDEISLLVSLKRKLRSQFDIVAAPDGESALRRLETDGPFSVIISDMKMPGMTGVEFLQKAKNISPHSSRILMTGDHSLETAINGINDGNIFQLVYKPCSADQLAQIIDEGITAYNWLTSQEKFATNWAQAIQEDFCAPLRHIIEFASYIESGRVPDKEIREYASFIRKRGRSLMTTSYILSSLSSARSKKEQLSLVPTPIVMLAETLHEALSDLVAKHGVVLKLYTDDAARELRIDAQLFQIAIYVLAAQMMAGSQRGAHITVILHSSRSQEKTHYVDIINQMPSEREYHLRMLNPKPVSFRSARYSELADSSMAEPLAVAIMDLHGGTVKRTVDETGLDRIRLTLPD